MGSILSESVENLSGLVRTYRYLSEYVDADRLLADDNGDASVTSMFAFGATVVVLRQMVCRSYSPLLEEAVVVREHGDSVVDAVEAMISRISEVGSVLRNRGATDLAASADEAADGLAFWLGAFVQSRMGDVERGRRIASRGGLYEYSIGEDVDYRDHSLLDAFADLYAAKSPGADEIKYLVALHLDEAATALAWGDYPAAASRSSLAARLAPTDIEPHLVCLDALSRRYLADGRKPTAQEIAELEDLHGRLLAQCAGNDAVVTFVADHGRRPEWSAAAILSNAYVQGDRLLEARRLLKDTIPRVAGGGPEEMRANELYVLLSQVNDALAGQVELFTSRRVGLEDLPQGTQDEFRATIRRLELITQVKAPDVSVEGLAELVNSLSQQMGRQGTQFPDKESNTKERLAIRFGPLWERLTGAARTLLITAETLHSEMAPHQSGEPAVLALGFATAIEALLRTSLRLGTARVTFGQLVEILARSSSPTALDVTNPVEQRIKAAIEGPDMAPWKRFWTGELPAALRRSDMNIVTLRNRVAHGDQGSWDDLENLRARLLGDGHGPGLIQRILQAQPV